MAIIFSLSGNDILLSGNDFLLIRNYFLLGDNHISLRDNNLSLSENDISLSGNEHFKADCVTNQRDYITDCSILLCFNVFYKKQWRT